MSNCTPLNDSLPKKPFRSRTAPSVTVSGTYIIRTETIKPGPRLIFDESVSRIEYDKLESGTDLAQEDGEESADDVTDDFVKEELNIDY